MERAGRLLGALQAARRCLTPEELALAAWPAAVGKKAARHTKAVALDGSRLVVGPEGCQREAIVPLVHTLTGIQEVLAVGTLFPDAQGEPVLHLHAATGREGAATVGCSRAGVEVWLVGEVVILEILGTQGCRRPEAPSGFSLLQFPPPKGRPGSP